MAIKNDKAPPGREKQVEALEEQPGVDNPYAVAWASYNKETDSVAAEGYDALDVPAEHLDVIRKRGSSWVLLSKKTGKVLGTHATKEEAAAQERAVQASKHADARSTVRRFDFFKLDDLEPAKKLDNGFLQVQGRIARVGVQVYHDVRGNERRELRLPEEVFHQDALKSFQLVPMTNLHPRELLDAQSARRYAVGSVGQPEQDGDWVKAPLMLWDAEAIQAAQCGRQELSCGYSCELDETPGVHPKYGRYDAVQRDIRGNHVALVDSARAGENARLRLDGSRFAATDGFAVPSPLANETERVMAKSFKCDGLTYEMTDNNAEVIQAAHDRALTAERERSTKAVEALQKKLDHAESEKRKAQKIALVLKMRRDAEAAEAPDSDGDFDEDAASPMVACDKCDGSGLMKSGGEKVECDKCDGSGKVPTSKLGESGGEVEDDDMADADEMEVEEETENEAKEAHKDWAQKRSKKRADARKRRAEIRKLRADARKKAFDAAVAERVGLEVVARQHLGADAKLDGLDTLAIKRAVVAKLDNVDEKKAEKFSEAYVSGRYDVLLEQAKDNEIDPISQVRAGAGSPSRVDGNGADPDAARERMLKAKQDAWKNK